MSDKSSISTGNSINHAYPPSTGNSSDWIGRNPYGNTYVDYNRDPNWDVYKAVEELKKEILGSGIVIGSNFITVLPPKEDKNEREEERDRMIPWPPTGGLTYPGVFGSTTPYNNWGYGSSNNNSYWESHIWGKENRETLTIDGKKLGLTNVEYISDIPEGYKYITIRNFPSLKELPKFPEETVYLNLEDLPLVESIDQKGLKLVSLEIEDLYRLERIDRDIMSEDQKSFIMKRCSLVKELPEFNVEEGPEEKRRTEFYISGALSLTEEYVSYHNMRYPEEMRIKTRGTWERESRIEKYDLGPEEGGKEGGFCTRNSALAVGYQGYSSMSAGMTYSPYLPIITKGPTV